MTARVAIAAAIALIAAALAWHAQVPIASAPQRGVAVQVARAGTREAIVHAAASLSAPEPARAARADSLRGTRVDGAVHLAANGAPVADRDLRRLFDYFLARLGERDPATIRTDVLAYLRDTLRLDDAAQAQVLAWFDLYVATGRSIAALPRGGDAASDVALLRRAHEHYLGSELARAWYGAEDDYAAYTAQRLALQHDAQADARLRSRQLDELDASLDPDERDGRHAATDFQIVVAQSRELDVAGADADARYAERAALWGDAAATRLAAMDDANARWEGRVQAYARARAALLADPRLSAAARATQIDALLATFSDAEQRRLLSLTQANLLPAP